MHMITNFSWFWVIDYVKINDVKKKAWHKYFIAGIWISNNRFELFLYWILNTYNSHNWINVSCCTTYRIMLSNNQSTITIRTASS